MSNPNLANVKDVLRNIEMDHESGNVEAPTGWFGARILGEISLAFLWTNERALLESNSFEDIREHDEMLMGNWLVRQDSDGHVSLELHKTEEELEQRFEELEAEYAEWESDEDPSDPDTAFANGYTAWQEAQA